MKIMNKIRAFFFHQDSPVELDLVAAEIKEGKAFLHPRDEDVTYLVRSDDVEIHLSRGRVLTPKDIHKVVPPKKDSKVKSPERGKEKVPTGGNSHTGNTEIATTEMVPTTANEFDRFKKRKFVVSLYQEEYASIT